MTDNKKRNATKRYQNSDYPSGSFEAAISVDQGASSLRLVREPSPDGRPADDLEEMVPAFMHRDFFRTEEDGVDPVPAPSALRTPVASAAPPVTPPVPGYMEPPNTEEIEVEPPAPRPPAPTAVIPPSAPSPRTPISTLKTPPVSNRPVPPPLEPPVVPTGEPIAPLRSHEIPPAPEPPRQAPRASAPEAAPSGQPDPASVPTPAPASSSSSSATAYSLPLLAALAMVLGVFVWRESTRPVMVTQQPLPVPQTAPSAEPSAAAPGFQPKYLSVGPAVPPTAQPSGSPTPGGAEGVAQVTTEESDNPAGLFPGDSEQTAAREPEGQDDEADERAEMLNRVAASAPASSSEQAPVRVKNSGSNNPGALFPTDAPPERPAPKPATQPKPASKAAAVKAPDKAVNRPSAADLFPIDEEIPVRRPSVPEPVVSQPAEQPPIPAISSEPVLPPKPGEPYQIDEPNL